MSQEQRHGKEQRSFKNGVTTRSRFRLSIWLVALALLVSSMLSSIAPAQPGVAPIIYNKIDAQGYMQLWQTNPDGTGARQLPGSVGFPVWSRDGRQLAVSAPVSPNVLSWNVFVYNPQTGNRRQVTNFHDQRGYVLPFYKAFSPDGQRVAVSSYYRVTNITVIGNTVLQILMGDWLFSGSSTTPVLEIYSPDGSLQARVAIAMNAQIHQGDGVDWSPTQDLLVYPFDTSGQGWQGLPVPLTALFAMRPVNDAIATGQYRQLTSPRAYYGYVNEGPYTAWEQDFQPAFSPNGRQVAYIRALSYIVGATPHFSIPSLRIVNIDGTNDHEVARFREGNHVSHISWSPDGSKLIIDGGAQAYTHNPDGSVFPLPMPDFGSMGLYTLNADGSNFRQIQGQPSFFPSWNPAALR